MESTLIGMIVFICYLVYDNLDWSWRYLTATNDRTPLQSTDLISPDSEKEFDEFVKTLNWNCVATMNTHYTIPARDTNTKI